MTGDTMTDLELAREAVRAAGEVVMTYFRRDLPVQFKAPEEPVTAADFAADRLLFERLTGERPEYGWLSEESADSGDRLSRARVWVVDPIDGTNSFVEGRPEFVINLGLVEDGVPILAVVYNPVTEELYDARRGEGAFLNGERIRVGRPPAPGERPVLAASRSELREGVFDPFREEWSILPLGSTAYRMLKVADGTAHASFSQRRKFEWDVCGAALVVSEAGGTVRQIHGERLHFNRSPPVFRGVVATGEVGYIPLLTSLSRTSSQQNREVPDGRA